MIGKLKQHWDEFRRGKPGSRFQDAYRSRHERGVRRGRRTAKLLAGGVVLAAGLFFLPAPGPGVVIVVIGAGLVAQESRFAARALDWSEVRVRRVIGGAHRAWKSAPPGGKVAILLLAAGAAAGAGYLAWRLMFA